MAFDGSTLIAATTGTFVANLFTDTFSCGNNDVDMVALTLRAGARYVIDVDNGTAGDFYLRVFDMFGSEVRANDDGNRASDGVVFALSPYIEFVPNYSGRYFVAISPYYLDDYDPATTAGRINPENPLVATSGTLTVALDLSAITWPSAGAINSIASETVSDQSDVFREEDRSLRVSYAGVVDSPTDIDMARIDLSKGDIVVVDVNGVQENGTTLRIFDGSGVQIGFDDNSGFLSDPELIFVAPFADDYYIAISGDGNSTYNPIDGTGAVAGAVGEFEVIIHRNPTQTGSSLGNSFNGSDGNNYIVALAGNDTVLGNAGQDTLAGGDDLDTLNGGDGRDVLYGEYGNDTLDGFRGSDILLGGVGNDRLSAGIDPASDFLDGGAGDDTLLDGNGADTLLGGTGADSLNGGQGNNLVEGGDGNDTLIAGSGADTLLGEGGDDFLNGTIGNNRLDGGGGADTVRGNSGIDTIFGGTGADSLTGFGAADTMAGGADADTLIGGAGSDTLSGDLGNDVLTGGADPDVFAFNAIAEQTDVITDLVLGEDRIDLTGIFGVGVVNAGNLAQFVQTSTAGITDSFLAVDANGVTGGLSFSIIAQVSNVTAAQLFDVNNFIL